MSSLICCMGKWCLIKRRNHILRSTSGIHPRIEYNNKIASLYELRSCKCMFYET
uniref:Uncharacterized protein n=1 Tax=Helianthus annuus TaxID=4232 RepID=A0A251T0N4_HELAN